MRAVLAAWLLAGAALAAPPEIGQVIDPSRGGETILLSGEGFDEKTVFRMWVPEAVCERGGEKRLYASWGQPPAPPREPPGKAFELKVHLVRPRYAALEMPEKLRGHRGAFRSPYFAVLWAGSREGWGMPYALNRARLFFAHPAEATPGQTIRLFGRNLVASVNEDRFAPRPQTACLVGMRLRDGRELVVPRKFGEMDDLEKSLEDYRVTLVLPRDLQEGDYEVRAHSGSGGEHGWSDPIALSVRRPNPWPSQTFKATDFDIKSNAGDQTDRLNKALDAVKKNGGGVLALPAGIFIIKGTLQVPPKSILRGAGEGKTILRSAPDPKPNSAMIELAGPCRMEKLSVELPGQVPRGAGAKLNGPGIVIDYCTFRTEHFLTWGQGPLPNTILGDLIDGEIARCSFEGISHCFLPRTQRSRIAYNRVEAWHFLTGGGGGPGLGWGTKHTIFENNHIV
ncbi:MAG: hypothetical protein FJ290_31425, partial [Planctomycetes bacterium]|nr:hypothetical protein [Planctomycetota bacterium]